MDFQLAVTFSGVVIAVFFLVASGTMAAFRSFLGGDNPPPMKFPRRAPRRRYTIPLPLLLLLVLIKPCHENSPNSPRWTGDRALPLLENAPSRPPSLLLLLLLLFFLLLFVFFRDVPPLVAHRILLFHRRENQFPGT